MRGHKTSHVLRRQPATLTVVNLSDLCEKGLQIIQQIRA